MGEKLTDVEVYQYYNSIKTHFNSKSYDYFKYGKNKTTFTEASLEKRNDRYKFFKLMKMINVLDGDPTNNLTLLLFSWLFYKSDIWIGDIVDDKDKSAVYLIARRRWKDAPVQEFKTEFDYVCREYFIETHDEMERIFFAKDKFPVLINMMISKKISPEFIFVIDIIYDALNTFDRDHGNSPIWKMCKTKIEKIKPLFVFTQDQIDECCVYIKQKLNDNF